MEGYSWNFSRNPSREILMTIPRPIYFLLFLNKLLFLVLILRHDIFSINIDLVKYL